MTLGEGLIWIVLPNWLLCSHTTAEPLCEGTEPRTCVVVCEGRKGFPHVALTPSQYPIVKAVYGVKFCGNTCGPRSEMWLSRESRLFLAVILSLSNLGFWIKLVLSENFCTLWALSKCTVQVGKEVCHMLPEEQSGSCLSPGLLTVLNAFH